jgi:hypothetical protein
MRAILLLLMVTAGCGSNTGNQFELDLAVNAPQATSVVVDGTATVAPGAIYARGFSSVSAAKTLHGTVATVNADGSVRSTAPYELGAYCNGSMPLLRQTLRFVEGLDGSGGPLLALDSIECEKTDGTGTIVSP